MNYFITLKVLMIIFIFSLLRPRTSDAQFLNLLVLLEAFSLWNSLCPTFLTPSQLLSFLWPIFLLLLDELLCENGLRRMAHIKVQYLLIPYYPIIWAQNISAFYFHFSWKESACKVVIWMESTPFLVSLSHPKEALLAIALSQLSNSLLHFLLHTDSR